MRGPLPIAHLLAGPIERLGVDYPRFRALLALKLSLDGRRRHGWVQGTSRISPLTWSLIVHGGIGLWVAMVPYAIASPLTAMSVCLSIVMLMLTFDLVADYSAVLLDPADASLLGAYPLDQRTLLAVRVAHVAIYLGMYVGAVAAGSCVSGALYYAGRPFLLAYLPVLAWSVVMVLAAVTLVYLVIMRTVSPDRIRDVIMYAQLVMTLLTVAGYFVMSSVTTLRDVTIAAQWWVYAYPPAWLAGIVALAVGDVGRPQAVLAVLGLVAPGLLAWAAIRLAPAFRIDAGDAGRRPPRTRPSGSRLAQRIGRLVGRTTSERALFELVWLLAARNRQFKTRTYPALVAVVLFVAAGVLLVSRGAWGDRAIDVDTTDLHLFLLYYGVMVIPMPLLMLPYAERPEAAWIYRCLPIDRPGTVLRAGGLVVLVRFVLPVFGMIATGILLVWGARVVADVVLAFVATLLATACVGVAIGRRLPFSEPPPGGAAISTVRTVALYQLVVAAMGGLHWVLVNVHAPLPRPWPALLPVPLVLLGAWVAARIYGRTTWARLAAADHGPASAA